MALQVSDTFRQNCYDSEKAQRLLLKSDGITLSNEDISGNGGVKFNLACITAQQVTFGEVPTNSINVSILNEDGRIGTDDIAGKEFACNIGVEVDRAEYNVSPCAISAIDANGYTISVHCEAPYVRGNCSFASILPQLEEGYPCKIVFDYGVVYFVVDDGTDLHFAKHTETGYHSYGAYSTPSDLECAMLTRIMSYSTFDGIAYFDGGMSEFTYKQEYEEEGEWATETGSVVHVFDALAHSIKSWVVGLGMTPSAPSVTPSGDHETWDEMNEHTWGEAKERTWRDLSGYSIFDVVRYESCAYGVWHFDRPRRANTAVLSLAGKDRMTIFDEDSVNFASDVANTLLTAKGMILAIAKYKSVPVGDLSGMNALADEITIDPKVYYNYKSLKDLLSYAAEVCGVCLFFDRWGRLSCNNADNIPVELPYVYTFDVADYTAHTIGKMLVYHQGDYFVYQEDNTVEDGVTYEWGDNPFFTKPSPTGSWFSSDMHKKYGGFRNAITVTDADYSLWCDDVYSWTDVDNVTYREPIFTMSVEWNGTGRVTYTNYGEEVRPLAQYDKRIESVSSINDNNLQGFNKAQNADKLYFDENGLTVESSGLRVKNADGLVVLDADDEGNLTLTGKINAESGFIGNFDITHEGLRFEGEDTKGNPILISFEPTWGSQTLRIAKFGESRSVLSQDSLVISSIDSNGSPIGVDAIFELTDGVGITQLNIGFRTHGTPSNSLVINIIGEEIWIPGNANFSESLPTTTSSANMVVSNDKIYRSTSLRKVKDNIKTIENASEKVDNLRGVSFTSKCEADDPKKVFYGFIAEEVEKIAPELCTYENGELQGVQYDRVCALLLEDNKACHKRIEELEKRLEEIERRLK